MRTADTVLGIIQERGKQGLPLEDVYRQLYNPELYLWAYGRIYSNDGAMTAGSTQETVDRMSLDKIYAIIDDLRHERYRWTPVKRVYIPKKNGKLRALGLPSWSDKLLQEVLRLILEAYYEPQMSNHSHGFRPDRGCHTALSEVKTTWTGTKWFVEGDISQCFDRMDHGVLMDILREKIHDNRFLRLIQNLLQAGYLEEWAYHQTLSGVPQGGVISPILSNIYLDKLDTFVEQTVIPVYTQGKLRKPNNQYFALMTKAYKRKKQGKKEEALALMKQAKQLPTSDPYDPDYRRLTYVRYADDWLLGFAGPKAEAEAIKRQIGTFLRETLKLELSEEKTLITHATEEAARFLGYELVNQQNDQKRTKQGSRNANGRIGLRVPADVIKNKCAIYQQHGKPCRRPQMLADDDYTIMCQYQAEYRGVVQYYMLALNVSWFHKLRWVMQVSLLKTLANKHKSSVSKMAHKYKAVIQTAYGPQKGFEIVVQRENGKKPLIARFGGIPLRHQKEAVLIDKTPKVIVYARNELIKRLLADACELCGSRDDVEVHHIRKLADLKQKGRKEKPIWMQVMSYRRRKTLVVCHYCHEAIHAGRPTAQRRRNTSLESRIR